MREIDELTRTALERVIHRITDSVFLEIQGDRDLMQAYLRLLNEHDVERVNKRIGNQVRKFLNLSNTGRVKEPESTLIKSYESHGIGN